MILQDKTAVIYGSGGFIGNAGARAFVQEGARVFLRGRPLSPLEILAHEIIAAGGPAEAGAVDALDP